MTEREQRRERLAKLGFETHERIMAEGAEEPRKPELWEDWRDGLDGTAWRAVIDALDAEPPPQNVIQVPSTGVYRITAHEGGLRAVIDALTPAQRAALYPGVPASDAGGELA